MDHTSTEMFYIHVCRDSRAKWVTANTVDIADSAIPIQASESKAPRRRKSALARRSEQRIAKS